MTNVRSTKNKTSLALKMDRPGGRAFREIAGRADANLEEHREGVMASIGEHLETLELLCSAQDGGEGGRVYQLASNIIDLAGYFDTGPLYEAAYSLCDTADRLIGAGAWSWPPITLVECVGDDEEPLLSMEIVMNKRVFIRMRTPWKLYVLRSL